MAGSWKTAIPCDCGCEAVLIWEFEPWGEEPHQVYVDFIVGLPIGGLRGRVKAAWRIVRGKDPWLHSIVLQDEGIEQLRHAIRFKEPS